MARTPATAAPAFFAEHFQALGTPERAAGEKAYLKSPLRFHGVTVPETRRACADFCHEHRGLDRERLRAEVDALMASDFHDLRSAAVGVLERKRGLLTADDLPWLVGLVRHTGNWAHVDWLATKVIGRLLTGHRRAPALLRAWAADPSLWARRTALIAQLDALRTGGGDFELFASVAVPMLAEREFFLRKAIGWVLREVSKRRPEIVRDFVLEHGAQASPLTFREATRCLPLAMRAGLPEPARGRKASAAAPRKASAAAPRARPSAAGRSPKGSKRKAG